MANSCSWRELVRGTDAGPRVRLCDYKTASTDFPPHLAIIAVSVLAGLPLMLKKSRSITTCGHYCYE